VVDAQGVLHDPLTDATQPDHYGALFTALALATAPSLTRAGACC
jgi:hypothetical protein